MITKETADFGVLGNPKMARTAGRTCRVPSGYGSDEQRNRKRDHESCHLPMRQQMDDKRAYERSQANGRETWE